MGKILKKVEIGKFIATALKSILKLEKNSKVWLRNVVKCGKCKPAKIANFVYFCIAHGKLIPTSRKRYRFSLCNTKVYKIR